MGKGPNSDVLVFGSEIVFCAPNLRDYGSTILATIVRILTTTRFLPQQCGARFECCEAMSVVRGGKFQPFP